MPKVEVFCHFYLKMDHRDTLTLAQTLITDLIGYSKSCTLN